MSSNVSEIKSITLLILLMVMVSSTGMLRLISSILLVSIVFVIGFYYMFINKGD